MAIGSTIAHLVSVSVDDGVGQAAVSRVEEEHVVIIDVTVSRGCHNLRCERSILASLT
mgnify:CR=1 FL=1